jgi:hypothetical protein
MKVFDVKRVHGRGFVEQHARMSCDGSIGAGASEVLYFSW